MLGGEGLVPEACLLEGTVWQNSRWGQGFRQRQKGVRGSQAIRTSARQRCREVNLGELTGSGWLESRACGSGMKMQQELKSRESRDRSWGPGMPRQAGMWRGRWHCRQHHGLIANGLAGGPAGSIQLGVVAVTSGGGDSGLKAP